jgi:hypothetical protein
MRQKLGMTQLPKTVLPLYTAFVTAAISMRIVLAPLRNLKESWRRQQTSMLK